MIDILAELGACHDGSIEKFRALITMAAEAGATHAKAQFWSSVDRMVERRHAESYRAIYTRYQMPEAWLGVLRDECRRLGIASACSVYLAEDAPLVASYVDVLKNSSFENSDRALLDACTRTGKPVIVSAGMLDGHSRDDLVLVARQRGGVSVIACISSYPCPVNGALRQFHDQSRYPLDGYSDHTRNVWTGAVAVGCGAQIIEVHVRAYDTSPMNPDYATALDPREFRLYAEGVRTAERLIADVPVDESAMQRFKVRV